MATDNTTLSINVGAGDAIRDFADTDSIKWQAAVAAYLTGGSVNAWTLQGVDLTHGLPVQPMTGSTWTFGLPTGASTAANQATGNTSLASILSTLQGSLTVGTLPAGLATGAKQDTGNTSVASIDTKTPALGQALAAASVPVVLPAAQLTTLTPPAAITGFATAANQVTELSSLSSIDTKTPALGQALAAASVPIVLTALQLTALTPPAAISGYATSAKQDTGNVSLSSIDGKITAVNTGAVVISSGVLTTVGAVTAITNALPAGSNAIGKLAANSGVIIGAVEIAASQTIGIAAGSAVIGHIILDSGAVNATLAAETTKVIGTVNVAASQTIGLAAGAAVIGHVIVDSGSITIGAALPAGTNGIGKLTANSGVTIGAVEIAAAQTLGLVAGTALVGKVGLDQTTPGTTNAVADQPVTSGGLSISSFLSTAAVQSTAVKASAGQVYGLRFFNIGAGPVYVRLYNQTTAPGSGDTPVWRGIVPGNTAGAGFSLTFDKGLAFGTGIGLRVTGAIADNDTTALAANVVIGDVEYK